MNTSDAPNDDRRVAIVTGAGAGIGFAVAHRLAADGFVVVVIGRTESKLMQTVQGRPAGTEMDLRVADVSDPEAITTTIDEVTDDFGRLDALVNNAGVVVPGTVEEIDPASCRSMIDTNIIGTFFASRAALPHLRATGGCIVNIGSVSAVRGDWRNAVYDMTKAAVANLTNAMALDHGHEIRVNAVHPGVTLTTPLIMAALADGSPLRERFNDRVPMRRPGEPDEVAAVVSFLASRDASYVNGAHIPVDGGLTASNGQIDLYRNA